ncbi:MAG TPA: NAD(P)-binding domain-containing protein, partial [Prolixibacteraceae bacterium]
MEIKNLKIAIVGGGNLGRSVADGFLKSGISASKLTVSRRRIHLLDDLAAKGICIEKDNKIAVAEAD